MSEEYVLDLDYASRVRIRDSIQVSGESSLIRNLVKNHHKTAKIETIKTGNGNYIFRIIFESEDDKLKFMMKYL